LRIDDRLHFHLATSVGQEAADLAEGEGSDAFQTASSASHAGLAIVVAEQRFFTDMDVQHDLGPQFADIKPGRPNDQPAVSGAFTKIILGRCRGVVERRLRFIVDGVVGLLRLTGGTLFVPEVPQQLQGQGGLGQDSDRFGAAYVG
jgi:hypothetical protein